MLFKALKVTLESAAALAALYVLAITPRVRNRADTSLFRKKYFAHRGLHDNAGAAPENSLPAFALAVEQGFGMELDVQVTRDGVPVVFHDYHLERICGVKGKIAEHTYEELCAYTLCGSAERIPRLSDVLSLVDGREPLIVEIKAETADVSGCAVIDRLLRAYKGDYCIESFNPLVLWWYRRHRREVARGQLSSNFRREGEGSGLFCLALTHLLFNFLTKPDFIAYNHKFRKEPGRRLCRWLYRHPAAAWTIRSQQELEAMQAHYDVFIFDSFLPEESRI